ncbi:MAG: 5-oxoprolinase subunit PxpA [Bacteroidota bacterium]
MEPWYIDINCDLGEGIGNEAQILPLISSCSIACGGHAGNKDTLFEIMRLAKEHGVQVGAHPSYPDKVNFGRKTMDISFHDLKKSLHQQLHLFQAVSEELNVPVSHIKPHGALYNQVAKDESLALFFLEVVKNTGLCKRIYAPYGSVIADLAAKEGIAVSFETFGDRNYTEDGNLVSRTNPNALILQPKRVLQHILPMIKKGALFTMFQKKIETRTDTICIHGDTETALKILLYLSKELPKHNVLLNK